MSSQTYNLIKSAIAKKQQIFATYDKKDRKMCPHAIGTKNGVEQAIFYQFGGFTSSGEITQDTKDNWRCITLSKLTNVTANDGEWHTFNNHSAQSKCIDFIDLQVPFN